MDITTLAAWGEFIGGIAVVVSLVYLASQIRQNSKMLRASTASANAQIQQAYGAMLAQDGDLAQLFRTGLVDRSALSDSDLQRFDALLLVFFQGNQQQFEFTREGLGLPLSSESNKRGLRRLAQQPGAQEWLREWGGTLAQEFSDHVDGLIPEGEAAG
jgi:hypothetical protein